MAEYDYVIAGGGSAASVAAMRLVRDFGSRVLMLERGPAQHHADHGMPAGYMKYLARDAFSRNAPDRAAAAARRPRPDRAGGKVLGGGSAVNAMVYMRGQREDYDGWAGLSRQRRRLVLRRHAAALQGLEANAKFNDEYHGIAGNLRVSDPGYLCDTTEDFLLAAQGAGPSATIPISTAPGRTASASCSTPTGKWQAARSAPTPRRPSSIRWPSDPRLTIVTEARVDRILIENGRAVGVAYSQGRQAQEARAEREVLVAAGTYNTRQAPDAVRHRPGRSSARVRHRRGRRSAGRRRRTCRTTTRCR